MLGYEKYTAWQYVIMFDKSNKYATYTCEKTSTNTNINQLGMQQNATT